MMSEHDSVVDEIVARGSKCFRAHHSASSNAFASFRSRVSNPYRAVVYLTHYGA